MDFFEELEWRGLVNDVTSPNIKDRINEGGLTFYIGTDPTADSLHIGHYSSLLMAKRLEKHGHHPLMLVGGATGFIGDPKPTSERAMLTAEQLEHNFKGLHDQISKLFGFEMVNNLDWTKNLSVIDFLRDYGKFFNVNTMLAKDTVKRRLDSGISYTEFSYMILQAMDFYHLYKTKGCTMQIGGQDQWGNMTAGLDLIRKKEGDVEAFCLTMPLITKADGTKFGKSESGTVWLDGVRTTPYELYQFLLNTEDAKVIEYLKKLTMLEKEEIEALEESLAAEPHLRKAQKALAEEVVRDVHGQKALDDALAITAALFQGKLADLSDEQRRQAVEKMDIRTAAKDLKLEDLLIALKIASSKREAREWTKQGSISVNGEKIKDPNAIIGADHFYVDDVLILKKGKKLNTAVRLVEA